MFKLANKNICTRLKLLGLVLVCLVFLPIASQADDDLTISLDNSNYFGSVSPIDSKQTTVAGIDFAKQGVVEVYNYILYIAKPRNTYHNVDDYLYLTGKTKKKEIIFIKYNFDKKTYEVIEIFAKSKKNKIFSEVKPFVFFNSNFSSTAPIAGLMYVVDTSKTYKVKGAVYKETFLNLYKVDGQSKYEKVLSERIGFVDMVPSGKLKISGKDKYAYLSVESLGKDVKMALPGKILQSKILVGYSNTYFITGVYVSSNLYESINDKDMGFAQKTKLLSGYIYNERTRAVENIKNLDINIIDINKVNWGSAINEYFISGAKFVD